jgi:hypothetical protein
VSSPAVGHKTCDWPLFSPTWLGLVMKEAEWAESVVLYYSLPLFGLQLPEHFAMPGGGGCESGFSCPEQK